MWGLVRLLPRSLDELKERPDGVSCQQGVVRDLPGLCGSVLLWVEEPRREGRDDFFRALDSGVRCYLLFEFHLAKVIGPPVRQPKTFSPEIGAVINRGAITD